MKGDINDVLDDSDDDDDDVGRLPSQQPESHEEEADMERVRPLQQVHKAGFRDGKMCGEELVMQEGFDVGFSQGMRLGSVLGRLYGLLRVVLLRHAPLALPAHMRPKKNSTTAATTFTDTITTLPGQGKAENHNDVGIVSSQSIRKNTEVQELHQQCVRVLLEALPESYCAALSPKNEEEDELVDGGDIDFEKVGAQVEAAFALARNIVGTVFGIADDTNTVAAQSSTAAVEGLRYLNDIASLRDFVDDVLTKTNH
jgi:hypothetical protein